MNYDERYRRANNALNWTLLGGRYEDRPLYLVLKDIERIEVSKLLGVEVVQVERMICDIVGKVLREQGNPYEAQIHDARKWWRYNRNVPPPFTATLFALSHAAELMSNEGDFSGGNFYDRLGSALSYPADRLRFHGKHTGRLWQMFNQWLAQNDYEYGRPTAKPFNSNIHVNLPQSQALVRAGDRNRFHRLFERYGFSGSDDVTVDEMRTYIENWIRSSEANDRLRGAWEKGERRARICEIALAELASWVGSDAFSESRQCSLRVQQLSLVAALEPDFPSTRLSLQLGRTSDSGEEITNFQFDQSAKTVALGNFSYGSIATLSPNIILGAHVLDIGVTLRSGQEGSDRFIWRPRALIPFVRSSIGPYWEASMRLGLGIEHMVLVKNTAKLREIFETYLNDATIGSAVVATHNDLPGLPKGWLLYKNVLVLNPQVDVDDDLRPIVPLNEGMSLNLTGGLRLGREIWHSNAPPDVNFLSQDSGFELVVSEASIESRQPEIQFAFSHDGISGQVAAKEFRNLKSGEFIVTAESNGKVLAAQSVTLRSAKQPRPLHRQSKGKLSYVSCISAEPFEAETGGLSIEGFIVSGGLVERAISSFQPSLTQLPIGAEEPEEIAYSAKLESTVLSETCVSRGYHYWVCDMLPPGSPRATPLAMECRNCEQFTVLRNRGKRKEIRPRPVSSTPRWNVSPDENSAKVDHDVLLDALCYLGSGTSKRLETLLSSAMLKTSEISSIMRNLCALGLIDLTIERGSGRSRAWSVPPPHCCFTSRARAFLAGFRSKSLVADIAELIEAEGGKIVEEHFDDRPRAIWLENIDAATVEGILGNTVDPLGREVRIVSDGVSEVIAASATLAGIGQAFSPISLGDGHEIERFDPANGIWERSDAIRQPGAYRVDHAGRTYVYRSGNGTTRRGPYQLVKALAARDQGFRLHAYVPSEKRFIATLGAEPIGLLARSLVGASGLLPTIENGIMSYCDVPEDLAATVLHLLYEEPIFHD